MGAALVGTVDRPACRNALAIDTIRALSDLARRAGEDDEVRAAIVTGAGDIAFVAGGDLKEFRDLARDPVGAEQVLDMGRAMADLEACPVPVIAAVQGAALGGGCELILACDLVIAEAHATFTFRQAAMGLSTGWGGGARLVERVGPLNATRLLLLGETISAESANGYGLVNEVVCKGEAVTRALELTHELEKAPRNAVAANKEMLTRIRQEMRGDAHRLEAEVFASLWGEASHIAAMEEFFRRRK